MATAKKTTENKVVSEPKVAAPKKAAPKASEPQELQAVADYLDINNPDHANLTYDELQALAKNGGKSVEK